MNFASIDPRLPGSGELTFTIYPNPSNGHFTIQLGKRHPNPKIEIIDIYGKVVHSQQSINSTFVILNLELAAGTYTLQLTGEDGKLGVKKLAVE